MVNTLVDPSAFYTSSARRRGMIASKLTLATRFARLQFAIPSVLPNLTAPRILKVYDLAVLLTHYEGKRKENGKA